MAFQNRNMSVIAYANGFTLWHYKCDEPLSEIMKPDFFAPIWTLCAVGDIIIINADDSTCMRKICLVADKTVRLAELDK